MGTAGNNDMMETRKPSVIGRFFVLLVVTVLLLAAAGLGGVYVLLKGPSIHAGSLFTAALADKPVGNAVLQMFLTDEEIEQRLQLAQSQGGAQQIFSVYPQTE